MYSASRTLNLWTGVLGLWFCGFGFLLFSDLTLRVVGFGVLCGLQVFSNLVFGFRVLSTIMVVFSDFYVQSILQFFYGFAKEATPCSRAKAVSPRDLLNSPLPRLSF